MKNSIESLYNWYRKTLRHPQYRWWIILGTLAYLLFPFDISPDLFPIIGQVDDVAIAVLLVSELSQMVVEYIKSRQPAQNSPAASDPNSTGTFIDVDAVPVDYSASQMDDVK